MKFKDIKVGMIFKDKVYLSGPNMEGYVLIKKKDDGAVDVLSIYNYIGTHETMIIDRQVTRKIWNAKHYAFHLLSVISKAGYRKIKKRIIRIATK